MSYLELRKLPIKTFWFLNRQIDRLQAEDDLRTLHLHASVGSKEGVETIHAQLQETYGQIFIEAPAASVMVVTDAGKLEIDRTKVHPDFDRAGLHALKGLGKVV